MNRISFHMWLFAAVFAASGLTAATNQSWASRVWQADEGLPDNTVVGIGQTSDGYLVIATLTGLVRFDGVQFRPFAQVATAGKPATIIQALLVDQRDRLWIATYGGRIACIDHGLRTYLSLPENTPLPAGSPVMQEDREGTVWISYPNGVMLQVKDGQVHSITAQDGLLDGNGSALAVDGKGQLWFANAGWVGPFKGGRFHPLAQVDSYGIAGARSGGLWICSGAQLLKYAEDGSILNTVELPAVVKSKDGPTVFYEDRAGLLWLGTRTAGLLCYDGTGFVRVGTSVQTILSVKDDHEGHLWVGTRGGGLNQLNRRVVELQTLDAGPFFQAVRSVCQDTSGILWAVAWPGGTVFMSEGYGWTPRPLDISYPLDAVSCAADTRGGVWIGTSKKGLYLLKNGAVVENLGITNGLSSNWINALFTAASGEVWFGVGGNEKHPELYCRKDGQLTSFNLPAGSGAVSVLTVDSSGDCWAATLAGLLLKIHDGRLTDETSKTFSEAAVIRCLFPTPDGSLWIGYSGRGLGRLKAGRFSNCRMGQGISDDYISSILQDGRGRLWFAGNRGLFSAREKDLHEFMDGRVSRVMSVAYRQKEGLPRLQASFDSWPNSFRGTDGRLFFAMQSGVAVVYPNELKENLQPPSVMIEQVLVNGKAVAAYGVDVGGGRLEAGDEPPVELNQSPVRLRLPPGPRQIEFVYTAPGFKMPASMAFKYRLQGVDENWVEAGTRRVAAYPQLPPGEYRFQVIACNSDGVWNKTGASIALTMEAYWWETAWIRVTAMLSVFGILSGAAFLAFRHRSRIQVERLKLIQATELERARIAQDLHDDLGAGLTEIAMLSELARQDSAKPEAVNNYAGQIFSSASGMTQALDEIVWAVNPENDTVEKFVAFTCEFSQALLGTAGISCRFDMPGKLPEIKLEARIRHQLCMALKECLNNVMKHSRAKEVRIGIELKERMLSVTVEDDGVGFNQELQVNRSGSHSGLEGLRRRLTGINGMCYISSTPGQGTKVLLKVEI